jgi:hypothetical protein
MRNMVELSSTPLYTQFFNCWVTGNDSAGVLASYRAQHGVPGVDLVGFVYIDHECGVSMRVEFFCSLTWTGSVRDRDGPHDNDSMILVRGDLIRQLKVRRLSKRQVAKLGLADPPDWLDVYSRDDLNEFRFNQQLHPIRAPDFPDDVRAFLLDAATGAWELVWVRIERVATDGMYEGVLLNQPSAEYGLKIGSGVTVMVKKLGSALLSVCVGKLDVGSRTFTSR